MTKTTKIQLKRQEMIDRLIDIYDESMNDMGINELRDWCHELFVQNIERRNTSDLAKELADNDADSA